MPAVNPCRELLCIMCLRRYLLVALLHYGCRRPLPRVPIHYACRRPLPGALMHCACRRPLQASAKSFDSLFLLMQKFCSVIQKSFLVLQKFFFSHSKCKNFLAMQNFTSFSFSFSKNIILPKVNLCGRILYY
jgi:hypothetical protein